MDDEPAGVTAAGAQEEPDWRRALGDLERCLREAALAVASLRRGLEGPDQAVQADTARPLAAASVVAAAHPEPDAGVPPVEAREPDAGAPPADVPKAAGQEARAEPIVEASPGPGVAPALEPVTAAPVRAESRFDGSKFSTFDRLWDRIERERMEKQQAQQQAPPVRRGLDLLPQQFLMTVEDREGTVDLVPLHRGLQALPGVAEVNLVSYANGVPVIMLRVEGDLDQEQLGKNVSLAMDRHCEVIPQDNGRLYLRLRARED